MRGSHSVRRVLPHVLNLAHRTVCADGGQWHAPPFRVFVPRRPSTARHQRWRSAAAVELGPDWVHEEGGPRALAVGLLGAPNVGKSTLLNRLVGEKVAITSPKAQTTRRETRGVLTEANVQLAFYDTPGVLHPSKLQKRQPRELSTVGMDVADAVDLVLVVVDVTRGVNRQVPQWRFYRRP